MKLTSKESKVPSSDSPGVTLETEIGKTEHIFEIDYKLDKKLRSGSYGVVYITRHKKTHSEFAVKVIDRSKLKEKDDKATFREISIMKDLVDVKNVVPLVDVYIIPETFYIVQFYAKGGDVFDRLAKRVSYSEMDARELGVILMATMKEIHKRKICHRDMKPENLLLKSSHDDASILLADFGFAKYVPDEGLKTRCGTPAFVAPEILVGKRYNTQADMWSVGCLIFMLIGGYPPFQDETHRGLFRKIRGSNFTFHEIYWEKVSLHAKQVITNLLTVDPNDRLDADESLLSPWFQEPDENLSVRDLSSSISEMKKYNTKRTLKSTVQQVAGFVGNAFNVEKISDLMQQTDKVEEEVPTPTPPMAGGGGGENVAVTHPAPHKLNMSLSKKKFFADLYEVKGKIHRGSAGVVNECYSKIYDKKYAVKIIKRDDETDEQVLHEVAIMNQLNHDNLVGVVDYYEEDDFHYIVMELMDGGDVFDRIIDLNNYTEKDARDLAKILLGSVEYMHKSGVVHRDIKPQNILLESKDSNCAIKVGDFGFAKIVHTPKSLTARCGTPSYVAPEILKNQPYDQSCDMWSVGVVLYVMLCGYTPFMEENQEKMFERIKLGDWKFDSDDWSHVSKEAKALIKGLMNTNVDKRLTASAALKSKWITSVTDQYLSDRDLTSTMQLIKDKRPRLKDITMVFKDFTTKVKTELDTIVSNTIDNSRKATMSATSVIRTASHPSKGDLK